MSTDNTELIVSLIDAAAYTADEGVLAAAVLDAAYENVRPGIPHMLRVTEEYSGDRRAIVLGGPGCDYHRKAQYATTGRVSGWEFVLLPAGIFRREYSGTHSDFPDYHRVHAHDRVASALDVVTWSLSGMHHASDRLQTALQAIEKAATFAADAAKTQAARKRIERLRRMLGVAEA